MDLWDIFRQNLARDKTFFSIIDFPHAMEISRGMDICPLQDSFRFRARFIAQEIASVLIDDAGNLLLDKAQKIQTSLEKNRFFIGPLLENDAFIFEHIILSLRSLQTSAIQKSLQKFSLPLCHAGAERLIRNTLWPNQIKQIHIVHVKRAVLTAWFTWLRQTTGSCFATAPAILIQQKEPLQFIQDLFDLLTFGSLKRVIGGQEYSAPLCPSIEQFDLIKPLRGMSVSRLSMAPGLKAAIGAAGFALSHQQLQMHIAQVDSPSTPKELIESILLQLMHLKREEVIEEENLKGLEMNLLLAKQAAVYYQKPSERATKVTTWKKALDLGLNAYQALGDTALLRAWESTIASFSDIKLDIAKWNLYVSIGFHPDHAGGVGAFIYNAINTILQRLNQQIASLQGEYNSLVLIANNAEKRGMQGEFSHATYRASATRQQLQECAQEAEKISNLFPIFIQKYDRLIPESFQEIFDPSLVQNAAEMIDDSPAGFRLAHKHGRTISSQWTFIRTSEEFIRSLKDFFEYAERELIAEHPKERSFIEQICTNLIQYIHTQEFLENSIARTRKNSILHDPNAKPWEYISGGTMPALVMSYYCRQTPFSFLQKNIHSTQELLNFLQESALKTKTSALMHSPTHAFIFHPDWLPPNPQELLIQMQAFWKSTPLEDEEWLVDKFSQKFPEKEAALFLHRWRQVGLKKELSRFREALVELLSGKESLVDSFLFESAPLIHADHVKQLAHELGLSFSSPSKWLTPLEFKERAKAAWSQKTGSLFSSTDLDEKLASFLREKKLAAPKPILFADTNWSAWFFGLAISPNRTLQLWRFHRTAMSGMPMQDWLRQQINGEWIILHRPQEYTQDLSKFKIT